MVIRTRDAGARLLNRATTERGSRAHLTFSDADRRAAPRRHESPNLLYRTIVYRDTPFRGLYVYKWRTDAAAVQLRYSIIREYSVVIMTATARLRLERC